jgi:predicted enzyme related to lactoylglutathione lyase
LSEVGETVKFPELEEELMPTRDTAWPAGTPCWIDYNAPDIEGAKAFYTELFGWTYAGGDPEYGGYLTCQTRGFAAAGMAPQIDPAQPPQWTTYFAADDADAIADRIANAAGTVVMAPVDVGPMGRMAIAIDPQGNPFGLWQAGQHTGVNIYNEPGSLVWTEAAVDNQEAARGFYSEVFGFQFDDMEGESGYATFAAHGELLGGLGSHQPGFPKGWTTCFGVASTDVAVATVQQGGGTVTMAAQDTPFGRFAVVQDRWGGAFSVMQELPG